MNQSEKWKETYCENQFENLRPVAVGRNIIKSPLNANKVDNMQKRLYYAKFGSNKTDATLAPGLT